MHSWKRSIAISACMLLDHAGACRVYPLVFFIILLCEHDTGAQHVFSFTNQELWEIKHVPAPPMRHSSFPRDAPASKHHGSDHVHCKPSPLAPSRKPRMHGLIIDKLGCYKYIAHKILHGIA